MCIESAVCCSLWTAPSSAALENSSQTDKNLNVSTAEVASLVRQEKPFFASLSPCVRGSPLRMFHGLRAACLHYNVPLPESSIGDTMNLVPRLVFAVLLLLSFFGASRVQAQQQEQKPAQPSSPAAQKPAAEEEENPFAPEPPPTLPPGMKGADVNDPRAKLSAGVYNAGEAAMGMKHLVLMKKPQAFQLGTS